MKNQNETGEKGDKIDGESAENSLNCDDGNTNLLCDRGGGVEVDGGRSKWGGGGGGGVGGGGGGRQGDRLGSLEGGDGNNSLLPGIALKIGSDKTEKQT